MGTKYVKSVMVLMLTGYSGANGDSVCLTLRLQKEKVGNATS